jgi:protein SCO1
MGDFIAAPPATWRGREVDVEEKLGARLPLDARFRLHDGNVVTLARVLEGELPTIVTFNYSDCPMLCNLQLGGLAAVLPELAKRKDGALFWAGEQFRIVTISLDPDEDLVRLTEMRKRYIERLPEQLREDARRGWTFLAAEHPGSAASIRRVASAVGFQYTYIKERAEWAHPASLVFVSTQGVVTRYVHGIEFDPEVMRESILKAGASEPATAVGFMNRCYHFDPDANNHSRTGVLALRVGAAGFVVLLLAGLGALHVIRRSRPVLHVTGRGNRS